MANLKATEQELQRDANNQISYLDGKGWFQDSIACNQERKNVLRSSIA